MQPSRVRGWEGEGVNIWTGRKGEPKVKGKILSKVKQGRKSEGKKPL